MKQQRIHKRRHPCGFRYIKGMKMMGQNYQIEMEQIIKNLHGEKKKLFLHSCCAPCSSYVLEYLRKYFEITVFYYNPNISEQEEYQRRVKEQKRLICKMNESDPEHNLINIYEGNFEPEVYFDEIKGFEKEPEGGKRCQICFWLRLNETARVAASEDFDYFSTTLTISPLKNAETLNMIGQEMAEKWKVAFLPSDFKKKNGYKRSIELSKEHDLYRQDYCGCIFSKIERTKQMSEGGNK